MRHFLFILLWVCGKYAFASESWFIGGQEMLLGSHPGGALMNLSCTVKTDCMAFKVLSKPEQMPKISSGGKNPASEVCQRVWSGQVLIATRAGATQGFCRFSDGSFASLSGIVK